MEVISRPSSVETSLEMTRNPATIDSKLKAYVVKKGTRALNFEDLPSPFLYDYIDLSHCRDTIAGLPDRLPQRVLDTLAARPDLKTSFVEGCDFLPRAFHYGSGGSSSAASLAHLPAGKVPATVLRGFIERASTDSATVEQWFDSKLESVGHVDNNPDETNGEFKGGPAICSDFSGFQCEGMLLLSSSSQDLAPPDTEDEHVKRKLAKQGVTMPGGVVERGRAGSSRRRFTAGASTAKPNVDVLAIRDISYLMDPRNEFLGALLELPSWAQAKFFEYEVVAIVVRLKMQILRQEMVADTINFLVMACFLASQAYYLRDTVESVLQVAPSARARTLNDNFALLGNGEDRVDSGSTINDIIFSSSLYITILVIPFYLPARTVRELMDMWTAKKMAYAEQSIEFFTQPWYAVARIFLGADYDLMDTLRGRHLTGRSCCTRALLRTLEVILVVFLIPFYLPLWVVAVLIIHVRVSFFNLIDICYIALSWASIAYHIYFLRLLNNETMLKDYSTGDISDLGETALSFAGWALIMVGFRLLGFLRVNPRFGPLVAMIIAIIRDMAPFLVVLLIILVSGGVAMPLLMGAGNDVTRRDASLVAGDGFADPFKACLTVYMWLQGEFDYAAIQNSTPAVIYFFIFMLITSIVMLNLLIAIMGDTYDRVREQEAVQTLITRAQILADYENGMWSSAARLRLFQPWTRCISKSQRAECAGFPFFAPWSKDAAELRPDLVVCVKKHVDHPETDESAQWSGRVAQLRKEMNKIRGDLSEQIQKNADQGQRIEDLLEQLLQKQPRAANDGGEETKTARRSSNDDSAKNNASEQDFAV